MGKIALKEKREADAAKKAQQVKTVDAERARSQVKPVKGRSTISLFGLGGGGGSAKTSPAPPAKQQKQAKKPAAPTISLFGLGGGDSAKTSPAPPAKQQKQAKKPAAPRGVPAIVKWRLNSDGSISGRISGSRNFRDGEQITTSPIVQGRVERGSTVKTGSGSQYFLS